jgi:hypothetical protein
VYVDDDVDVGPELIAPVVLEAWYLFVPVPIPEPVAW